MIMNSFFNNISCMNNHELILSPNTNVIIHISTSIIHSKLKYFNASSSESSSLAEPFYIVFVCLAASEIFICYPLWINKDALHNHVFQHFNLLIVSYIEPGVTGM
jgi:hypothetical protein